MQSVLFSMLLIFSLIFSACTPTVNVIDRVSPASTGSAPEEISTNNILNLSGQRLTQVSQDVFKMSNLQELNVSNNNLTGSLPAEIRHLQKLEVLNASNNQMTGVPAEIGQLQNLRVLNLANNQLTGLPNELGNLKNLKIFNLSGNNYSTVDLDIIRQKLPADVQIIL